MHILQTLDGQSVTGIFFFRKLIEDHASAESVQQIVDVLTEKLSRQTTVAAPVFTLKTFRQGRLHLVYVAIALCGKEIDHLVLLTQADGLRIRQEIVRRDPTKGMNFKQLNRYLKPSHVKLTDEQVEHVCTFLSQYTTADMTKKFVSTLRFDLDVSAKFLGIRAYNEGKLFDQLQLVL